MFLTWEQIQQMQFGGGMMMPGMMPMMGMGFGKKGGGKGGKPQPECKIRVENLGPGIAWQELKDHFGQVGPVEFSNVRAGVGEVRFGSAALAKQAVKIMNGTDLMGSVILVVPWQ